ncbi:MAG: translation initiation factor IF-1 [bacterium]
MTVQGTIVETLPSATFRVQLENGKEVLAYISGKMRMYRIKIVPGDSVTLEMAQASDNRGRIVRRL